MKCAACGGMKPRSSFTSRYVALPDSSSTHRNLDVFSHRRYGKTASASRCRDCIKHGRTVGRNGNCPHKDIRRVWRSCRPSGVNNVFRTSTTVSTRCRWHSPHLTFRVTSTTAYYDSLRCIHLSVRFCFTTCFCVTRGECEQVGNRRNRRTMADLRISIRGGDRRCKRIKSEW